MNYVGNFIKRPRKRVFRVGGEATRLFVAGNHLDGHRGGDPWDLISGETAQNRVDQPFPVATVTAQPARRACAAVVKSGGATWPRRDAVDQRVIRQLEQGTGGLIDSQSEVGGWPELRSGAALPDTDSDGMPDAWEMKRGLAPASAEDSAGDPDGDGYTNIEEYLNGTDLLGHDTGR